MKVHSFNPVAEAYTDIVSPYRFSQFLTLVHELCLRGDEQILDIGCGAGVLSLEVAKRLTSGGHLQGIDLSANMVELAEQTALRSGVQNTSFDQGDGLNLAFPDNTFDLVISSNAYPWVPDRNRFLAEASRVLRPGGRLGLVALSNNCYTEFAAAFRKASLSNPSLLPKGNPFSLMGAKLHTLEELNRSVERAGFRTAKQFKFSTVEPIDAAGYVERINAIVNENYLDHLVTPQAKREARGAIFAELKGRNGNLKITESSIFVIAERTA